MTSERTRSDDKKLKIKFIITYAGAVFVFGHLCCSQLPETKFGMYVLGCRISGTKLRAISLFQLRRVSQTEVYIWGVVAGR